MPAVAQTTNPQQGQGTARFESQSGDYIGGGERWTVTNEHGTFFAIPTDRNSDGAPDSVRISFDNTSGDDVGLWWDWTFTAPAGENLAPGSYDNAERDPFQEPENPGIDVSGDGRGCNTIAGDFIIEEIAWDCLVDAAGGSTLHITRFVANFEQHCERGDSALFGEVDFTATPGVACGSDPGTPGEPAPPPPPPVNFKLRLPGELDVEPLVLGNGMNRTVTVQSLVTQDFDSDVMIHVNTNAGENDDFHATLDRDHFSAPGSGEAKLTITTGGMTFPRPYQIEVVATSGTDTYVTTFTVDVQCDPPFILGTNQPKATTAVSGGTFTMNVASSGTGPFLYQWYRGMPGMTRSPVEGATSATLSTSTRESGPYWVRVSNACGSVDSQAGWVTTTSNMKMPNRHGKR